MTREEVRQESKETDGNPQVKARIRNVQREAARRRMMAEVPKADVIVTNPTHYAVALRYHGDSMRAPKSAKGAHLLAQRIREIGEQHHVPVLEARRWRALYHHRARDETRDALYHGRRTSGLRSSSCALPRGRRVMLAAPERLPVPENLDPEASVK